MTAAVRRRRGAAAAARPGAKAFGTIAGRKTMEPHEDIENGERVDGEGMVYRMVDADESGGGATYFCDRFRRYRFHCGEAGLMLLAALVRKLEACLELNEMLDPDAARAEEQRKQGYVLYEEKPTLRKSGAPRSSTTPRHSAQLRNSAHSAQFGSAPAISTHSPSLRRSACPTRSTAGSWMTRYKSFQVTGGCHRHRHHHLTLLPPPPSPPALRREWALLERRRRHLRAGRPSTGVHQSATGESWRLAARRRPRSSCWPPTGLVVGGVGGNDEPAPASGGSSRAAAEQPPQQVRAARFPPAELGRVRPTRADPATATRPYTLAAT